MQINTLTPHYSELECMYMCRLVFILLYYIYIYLFCKNLSLALHSSQRAPTHFIFGIQLMQWPYEQQCRQCNAVSILLRSKRWNSYELSVSSLYVYVHKTQMYRVYVYISSIRVHGYSGTECVILLNALASVLETNYWQFLEDITQCDWFWIFIKTTDKQYNV